LFRSSVFVVIKILLNFSLLFFRLSVIVTNLSEVIFDLDIFNFSNFKSFLVNNPKTQNPINSANLEDNNFILYVICKLFLEKQKYVLLFCNR
jgi:hypothetical protein